MPGLSSVAGGEDGNEQVEQGSSNTLKSRRVRLSHGVQFQTGRLVWSLTALPQDQVLTIKMFSAAREGRLEDLKRILDYSQCLEGPIPVVLVTPPAVSEHRISQYKFSTLSIVTEKGIYAQVLLVQLQ